MTDVFETPTAEPELALKDKLLRALQEGISDDAMKGIKKKVDDIIYSIEDDVMYRLKDDLAPNLVAYVVDMAKLTVEAILAGNESEMRRYLGCERGAWNGRTDGDSGWGRKREAHEWHSVIHGRLFEQGAVKLRADLVAAHRDLIASERILDLEDEVKSLVAQVNKAEAEKEALRQRLRDVNAY